MLVIEQLELRRVENNKLLHDGRAQFLHAYDDTSFAVN